MVQYELLRSPLVDSYRLVTVFCMPGKLNYYIFWVYRRLYYVNDTTYHKTRWESPGLVCCRKPPRSGVSVRSITPFGEHSAGTLQYALVYCKYPNKGIIFVVRSVKNSHLVTLFPLFALEPKNNVI